MILDFKLKELFMIGSVLFQCLWWNIYYKAPSTYTYIFRKAAIVYSVFYPPKIFQRLLILIRFISWVGLRNEYEMRPDSKWIQHWKDIWHSAFAKFQYEKQIEDYCMMNWWTFTTIVRNWTFWIPQPIYRICWLHLAKFKHFKYWKLKTSKPSENLNLAYYTRSTKHTKPHHCICIWISIA